MTTTKKPFWAEIKSEYMEEELDAGFMAIVIDAWKTDDDNEEGEVIAKVFGKMVKDEPVVFVDYRDYIALTNELAQEVIKEAKERMQNLLIENNQTKQGK